MLLNFANKPLIMGIINATPDSFYSDSKYLEADAALDKALEMVESGASILDIGGESTRPGSERVSAVEQWNRVGNIIKLLAKKSNVPISIDTTSSYVAERSLDCGATIVNDVSALEEDNKMAEIIAKYNSYIILMHKKGSPKTMQENPEYNDAVKEISDYLIDRSNYAKKNGIDQKKIILDPGIGFGKRLEDNLAILKHIALFKESGYPVLIALSRKSFIGEILKNEPSERLLGTIVAQSWAMREGADILRVHDVKECRDMIKMTGALMNGLA